MTKIRIRLISLLLAVLLLLGSIPAMPIFAEGELSLNVTVPFSSIVNFSAGGTTVTSNSFRIPSMVTLADGTIVAAADIRWNTTYDGGGLDTLVARSTDGGVSWSYVAANYLGDNGNVYNGTESTCFIDPCLTVAADGQTVYMLVDLYPYGVALNGSKDTAPSTAVGFDSNGNLKLSSNNHTSYDYYLEDGKIYSTAGAEVSGYTVDEYFNLYYNGTKTSNLFYSDSPYKVVRTGFLYLTKSTDGGVSWSAPTLLNLKTSSEQVCLVGPGRGITTSDGTMVFPVYSYHGDNDPSGNTQRLSFIYTDGEGWSRSAEFNYNWASEAAVTELANGNLRFFYRNGTTNLCYVDYNLSTHTWGSAVNVGVDTNSNTQLSAITYSKTASGKQVVLVSCPAGPSGSGSNQSGASYRQNGRIFVFTVDSSTGAMTLENTINVNNNDASFMYSCLTERSDGSVAILFEDHENAWGTGTNCYYTMDMKAYSASDLGVTFDGDSTDPDEPSDPSEGYEITLELGDSYTVTVSDSENIGTEGEYTTSDNAVGYTVAHTVANYGYVLDTDGIDSGAKYLITRNGYAVTTSSSSNNAWNVNSLPMQSVNLNSTTELTNLQWTISETEGGYYLTNSDGDYMTIPYGTTSRNYTVTLSSTPSMCDIKQSGNGYMIFANDCNVGLNDAGGACQTALGWLEANNTVWSLYKWEAQSGATTVTFNANSITDGTTVTIGDVVYKVIVNAKSAAETKMLLCGAELTFDAIADLGLTGTGYTVTYEETEDAGEIISMNGATVTAHESNKGTATVTATVKNADGQTVGSVVYTVSVSDVIVTDTKNIYLPVGGTATIEGLTGDILTSMLDTSLATVAPSEGTLDSGEIVITGVAEGKTAVIVGTVQINIFVNPRNIGSGANTSKYIYIAVEKMENCSVYYAINGGPLYQVEGAGILIDQTYTDGFNIMFFARPNDGYALILMNATGTDDQYYSMAGGEKADASDTDAWPFNNEDADFTLDTMPASGSTEWKRFQVDEEEVLHGFRWCLIEGNMDVAGMRDLFTRALALGAHGATTFTKNNNGSSSNDGNSNNVSTTLSFVAERLPTLEKSILKVERDGEEIEYNEDTVLKFGDVVTYQFTVTTHSSSFESFSNVILHDSLIGYNADEEVNIDGDDLLAEGQTLTFTASYTINQGDADKYANGSFVNEAHLRFVYKSTYSTGTAEATATASVSCRISGIVYYTWMEGLPEGITGDSENYPRPTYEIVQYGGSVTVKEYTGLPSYTVLDSDGNIIGVWRFDHWQYNGTDYKAGETLSMPINDNIGFTGIWNYEASPTFTVTYQWTNAPAGVTLPTDENDYYSGEKFTVNSTYVSGTEIDTGDLTYVFSGWKQNGVVVSGELTVGQADVVLVGVWTSNTNYTSLVISKKTEDSRGNEVDYSSLDANQTFIFNIKGDDGVDLTVTVHGNSSVTVDGLSVGGTYTVTEIASWSWRYSYAGYETDLTATTVEGGASITLGESDNAIVFVNERSQSKWLDGDSWVDNIFGQFNNN